MTYEQFSKYSFLLDRTARKVKQYAQQKFKLKEFDITVDQWLVLKNLNENERLSQTELAHPEDRRSYQLHLTQEGKDKVKDLKPQIAAIRQKAWENLDEKDFGEFKRILNTIYNNLAE